MSSKKTVLKETPSGPVSSQHKVKQKNEYLRECINTILRRQLLHLNVKKVFDILANDLNINLKNVSERMKYVLCECLCYYMKMWPGWKQYDVVCTNERLKTEYLEKFKEYLIFKIKYIMENETIFNSEVVSKQRPDMVSQEIQTEPISKKNKPEAPYNLVISGQPNVLNNIVFIEMDNNIVIKQHAEKAWKPLTVSEFLNYSFVNVSITLPDLKIARSNLHEFQRYITECGDSASCPDVDFITYIKRTNSATKPTVYTKDYIHAYCRQFLETIKKIQGINLVKITELEEVFRQFILDIEESNVFGYTTATGKAVNTMATNTSVCFNIGGKTYIRNKKMVVNNDKEKEANAINFCEVLIPRMAYTLGDFSAEEDTTTEETSFKSLNEINSQISQKTQDLYKFIDVVNSCVTYQCLLCPKVYTGTRAYIDVLDHYRFLHKGEQSVLCFTCRKQFAVVKLAGSRWSHDCTNDPKSHTAAVSDNAPVSTKPAPIGISDILSSKTSSISVADFQKKQDTAAGSPSDASSSAANNLVRVSVNNIGISAGSILDSFNPSAQSSVVVPSSSVTVLPNTFSLAFTSSTVPSNPQPMGNLSCSAPAQPAIFDDPSLDINDNSNAIKSELYEEPNQSEINYEGILATDSQLLYPVLDTTSFVVHPTTTLQTNNTSFLMANSNIGITSVNLQPVNVGPLGTMPMIAAPSDSIVTTSLALTNNLANL